MSSDQPNPYDQVAYTTHASPDTHPDRLATIARLYGMQPAPVDKCRVLEIGCGDAANLLPMAYTLPASEFLGIDLAQSPIIRGREGAAALGVGNLRLEAMDLLKFPPDGGEFDYIIAHGVYSWTPPAVRAGLLDLCGRHLAPNGVAFVSFNAYPGYHLREMQRRMMVYHVDRVGEGTVEERARQALSLLGFLSEAQTTGKVYKQILDNASEYLGEMLEKPAGVAWFHHDLLETNNQPFYLHEFVRDAAERGMQFLAEAKFRLAHAGNYPPAVTEVLRELGGDPVAQEQYRDFIECVPFRRVVLCRQEVALDRSLAPDRVLKLHVRGELRPAESGVVPDLASHAPERFQAKCGTVTPNHPLAKAAIRLLGPAWPHGYAFADLLAAARTTVGTDEGTAEELGEMLIMLYAGDLLELSTLAPFSTLRVSERPEASAVARRQILEGPRVTSLRHQNGELEGAFIRRFLPLVDGTRTRADILREMRGWVESGTAGRECAASIGLNGQPEPVPTLEQLEKTLDDNLQRLARLELLVR